MPSDISDAVTQDQLADSLMSEPEETTESAQDTGTEEQVVAEGEETAEQLDQSVEEETNDWLPTEQEKVFPDDVLNRYAEQRYPEIMKLLANDPTNGQLKQLLHDKLNTDIYLKQQQQLIQQRQEIEEETEPVQQRQEPTQPQITTQQWMQQVEKVAESITDKEVAGMFANQFLTAFGVKEPATPETAMALTKTMTTFGLNLLNTVLPQMLNSPMEGNKTFFQSLMEKNYEAFQETYEDSTYDRAWSKAIKDVPQLAGKSLGDIGAQLKEAATRFAGSAEDFENLVFKGKNGEPLSPYQNRVKQYSVLAKIVAGEKLTPAEAKTYVEPGKKAAARQAMKSDAGNLGSGKSNGQITGKVGSGPFQTNNDLFDDEAMNAWKAQHGSL